jgi:hypothetical protein
MASHLYALALFDVLGFESKFNAIGLLSMAELYERLIETIDHRNRRAEELADAFSSSLENQAVWTAEGDVVVFNRVTGAYASDSLLVWAHALFPEARGISESERRANSTDPHLGWQYFPIPCDRFLEACCEILCRSVEIGLPLRGAVAMGSAILDPKRSIFLGGSIIEAARLERDQRIIGASLCESYLSQTIPGPYALPMTEHVKPVSSAAFSGLVLNWPRHWRITRKDELAATIRRLNDNPKFSAYYENTLLLDELSGFFAEELQTDRYVSTRVFYPQFSSLEVHLSALAVRSNKK